MSKILIISEVLKQKNSMLDHDSINELTQNLKKAKVTTSFYT